MNRPYLLLDHALQAFYRGLNSTFVDICANPAATQFLCDCGGCTGTKKAIQNKITGFRTKINASLNERFVFLGRIF